ncbi:hypothetical protein [Serinicoccus kebangsaanensis]|uniref:hypothetical protein n=1 Tax=Serinicoccus kebangsaanensis TaxID=2602069 RepID=UPI00124DADD5|nr:hypothetical protein [Serinicoccus kebangsaanensis]
MNPTPDDRRRDATDEDQPMLLLGEDRPDVEDTTLEELREQEAELERRRQEFAEQAERDRERAQEQLADDRQAAEKALAARQRAIDEAERRLVRTERRLRKQAQRVGQGDSVPRVSTYLPEQPGRGRSSLLRGSERSPGKLDGMPLPVLLLVAAAVVLGIGTVQTSARADQGQVATFEQLDAVRVELREATGLLDTEMVLQATGDPEQVDAEGDLPSVALARQALQGVDSVPSYYAEDIGQLSATLSSTEGSEVRAATTWRDGRDAIGYSVAGYDVDESREAILPGSTWGSVLLVGGAALLLLTLVLLLRQGSRLAAACTGLALVGAIVLVAQDPVHDDAGELGEAHEEAADRADDVLDLVGDDIEVVLGLDSLEPYEQEGEYSYWARHYRLEGLGQEDGEWSRARADLGRTLSLDPAPEELRTASLAVLTEADAVRQGIETEVVEARRSVVEVSTRAPSPALVWPTLVLVVLLPWAGLGLESWRRRRREAR